MKSRPVSLLALALGAVFLGACASSSSGKAAVEAGAMPDAPQMPMPTAEHKQLLAGVGAWEGTLTNYMPGAPAEAIPARETVESIGGFWTHTRFECDFMGMPYIGDGSLGYDTERGKYVGTWTDSMSSYLAVMEGEMDSTGKLVMRWEAPDMTGKMAQHRSETVRTANDSTMTFYMGEGEGTKSMVISMKRKR